MSTFFTSSTTMRPSFVLALAVVASLHLVSAEDLEPITPPSLPFDPFLAKKFFDVVDPVRGSPHIVGGSEASPHSFPHQVALNLTIGKKHAFCGGSLISDRWIITAAHCADGIDGIVAIVGAHNLNTNEPTRRLIPIEEKKIHPEWKRSHFLIINDIALLKLKHSVEFDKNVKNIRLPKISEKTESFWNRAVTMTGWGRESDNSKTISPVLRFVNSRVVTNFYCNFRYFFVAIKDSHICASGWSAKGPCSGDSGGPMIIEESDGNKTLIGLTSFGINFGCEWSWPPVFTRVSYYLDWIHKTTGIEPRP